MTWTQTLRFEVVKPLGERTWDQLGDMLRAFRAPLHRAMNAAITEIELTKARGDETHPQTVAYRTLGVAWKAEIEAARERVSKGKPYRGDEQIVAHEPGSSLQLGAASQVYTRWQRWNKERWRGTMVMPTFRGGSPVYVASSSNAVRLRAQDGSLVLSLRMLAGRSGPVDLVVRPYGGSGFADARRLIDGLDAPEDAPSGVKLGDCRLQYLEPKRSGDHGSWQALVSWTRPDAPALASGRTMALRRGITMFLVAATGSTESREARTWSETGDDVVAHKLAYQARRRSLGRQSRQLGTGAHGHGKARRFEHVTRLEDAEARWVQNKCREVAARAVKFAIVHGCSRILLEDWQSMPTPDGARVTSWPYAQLKECIDWTARKHGLTIEEVATAYNARTCPLCGEVNEESMAMFRCGNPGCRLERPRELVAAWNMLIAARSEGPRHPHNDMKRAARRARGKAKT